MNKENDKSVDNLFKRKLGDPQGHVSYREEDWNALEQMLEKHKKRRGIVYWLPVLGSAAAVLLLFLGWLAFRVKNDGNSAHSNIQAINHHQQKNPGINGGTAQRLQNNRPDTISPPANYAFNSATSNSATRKTVGNLSLFAAGSRRTTGPGSTGIKDSADERSNGYLLAANPAPVFGEERVGLLPLNPAVMLKLSPAANASGSNTLNKIKAKTAFRPQFALSILAAPDINGAGSFQQGKMGTNVGLQFSAGLSKKLMITTGAIYSVKPYITNFGNYHTSYRFPETPSNVSADCRMIDIPLNIGYQVYHKKQNNISVGTGLSSYIMVHESYKFNYPDPYLAGPSGYTVPNSNKYFFGVLNLNATYQHQLNSKVGVSIQPYLKLPLTNIGYSQVRLQSTGVALGLSWNLNSSSKP